MPAVGHSMGARIDDHAARARALDQDGVVLALRIVSK